jgi:hypothetical protein
MLNIIRGIISGRTRLPDHRVTSTAAARELCVTLYHIPSSIMTYVQTTKPWNQVRDPVPYRSVNKPKIFQQTIAKYDQGYFGPGQSGEILHHKRQGDAQITIAIRHVPLPVLERFRSLCMHIYFIRGLVKEDTWDLNSNLLYLLLLREHVSQAMIKAGDQLAVNPFWRPVALEHYSVRLFFEYDHDADSRKQCSTYLHRHGRRLKRDYGMDWQKDPLLSLRM